MKIKLFSGEVTQIERDYNDWASGKKIVSLHLSTSLTSAAVPSSSFSGGLIAPKMSIAHGQLIVLAILYEEDNEKE